MKSCLEEYLRDAWNVPRKISKKIKLPFKLGDYLGEGCFGIVFSLSNDKAVKIGFTSPKMFKINKSFAKINDPYIVKIFDSRRIYIDKKYIRPFVNSNLKLSYTIMEKLKPLSKRQQKKFEKYTSILNYKKEDLLHLLPISILKLYETSKKYGNYCDFQSFNTMQDSKGNMKLVDLDSFGLEDGE